MTLRILTKVLLQVWSYDFYDMTLSTGKQRRHMINDGFEGECNDLVVECQILDLEVQRVGIERHWRQIMSL